MERQSASIMLGMGAAPAEVATQLARSAELGDQGGDRRAAPSRTVGGQRRSERGGGFVQARIGAVACRRPWTWVTRAETVECSTGPAATSEAKSWPRGALGGDSPEEEAKIRLRLPTINMYSAQRHMEENRRALQLGDISEVTRARHLAWLAYNLHVRPTRSTTRGGQRGGGGRGSDR